MSYTYLNWLEPNEHTEDYHNRSPNDKIFLLEIENKKYIFVGENLFCFGTGYKLVD